MNYKNFTNVESHEISFENCSLIQSFVRKIIFESFNMMKFLRDSGYELNLAQAMSNVQWRTTKKDTTTYLIAQNGF